MAAFYLDNDVAHELAPALQAAGHGAITARSIGFAAATDDVQLLRAASEGWTFVTHNRDDYVLLHEAWLRWSGAWRVAAEHAGILVIPQPHELPSYQVARDLVRFVSSGRPLTNELYRRRSIGAGVRWERWRLGRGWTST